MKEEPTKKSLLETLCPSRTRMVQEQNHNRYAVQDQLLKTSEGRLPTIVRASDGGTDGNTPKTTDKQKDTDKVKDREKQKDSDKGNDGP